MSNNSSIGFDVFTRTVVFLNKEIIDNLVKTSGVHTLGGFSMLAATIVKRAGKESDVEIKDGEEDTWCLGAITKDLGDYLMSFLKEPGTLVDIRANL